MKYISLAFQRIIGYTKNHRLVFCLFFLGATISSFAFTYLYGNSQFLKISYTGNNIYYRMFEVVFSSVESIHTEQLHCLDQYNILEIEINTPCTISDADAQKLPPGSPIFLSTSLNNYQNLSSEGITPIFPENLLNQDLLVIDKAYGSNTESFSINGTSFPVYKTVDQGIGFIYVSFDTFMTHFGTADYLMFLTKDILNAEELQNATEKLWEVFPSAAEIVAPQEFIEQDKDSQANAMIHTALMYIVALMSFLFLFKYMIDHNSYENAIYYIVGASKSIVFFILLIEVLLLSTASSLIAILIHAAFYKSIFSTWNQSSISFSYYLSDYLFILVATVLLALITTLPFLFTSMNRAPVDMKGLYEE